MTPTACSIGARLLAAALLAVLALGASAVATDSASYNKFLLASDIHFNPMADASLVPALAKADPTEWEAILQRSQPHRFSPYGQDTNWWLLQSALDQMHRTMPHPAVFLVTGDLLSHRFMQQFQSATNDKYLQHYAAFVQKTVQFLTLALRRRWSNTQILLTPGNNDDDCQDYSIYANGAFLSDTASSLRELARGDEHLAANWKALGSYSVMPPTIPGVRIVSVNTLFFSARYQARDLRSNCAAEQSNAASETFAWLERTLSDARQANQKVWLMFHIPPGIDGWASTHPSGGPVPPVGEECVKDIVPMWIPDWTARFEVLVENYRNVVATFVGHTHTDNFLVMGSGEARQFVLVDPPISPIYDQNPAFRTVEFARDGEVKNYTTYYLTNLAATSSDLRGRWKKEYDFARAWKTRPVNAASLDKIYGEITSTDAGRQRWLKFNNVSSDAVKIPPDLVPGLYCVIEGLSVEAYSKCACGTRK